MRTGPRTATKSSSWWTDGSAERRLSAWARKRSWYEHPASGPEVWPPHAGQEPRLHGGGGAYARTRHRRHDRDFQRGECGDPASAALPGILANRDDLRN